MAFTFDFPKGDVMEVVDPHICGMGASVVPIVFRLRGGEIRNQGSGFCICTMESGDSVFATAKHVVAELEDESDIEPFLMVPDSEASQRLVPLRINQVALATTHSDVALVTVNHLDDESGPVVPPIRLGVALRPPSIAEYTMALGYGRYRLPVLELGSISYRMFAARGRIVAIHSRGRDNYFSNFPTFESSATYSPGMSGGPIINSEGRVVGVVSHGFSGEDDSFNISYGACLAAFAELSISLKGDNGSCNDFTVKELVEAGFIGASAGSVQLTRNEDGVELTWPSS